MPDTESPLIPGQAIRLTGVTKSWGKTTAINGIDLHIPAGSFTVLLGPSGCGKSTTLRMIAGLESLDSGTIQIDGRDVSRLASDQRNLSMVFQSYALFPHLTVAENIVFGLKVKRVGRVERDRRLFETASLLELTDHLHKKPAALSGGQQQRVALGRAIISRRPVCLMDEPLSNLDARLRGEMRAELRALQKQLGFTMVYVTHDQVEAITMADQVVLMRDGQIEQIAPPHEIYAHPATSFAASFIGTPPMNLLSGKAFGESLHGVPHRSLRFGLRPEDLYADPSGPLRGELLSSEFLGADTLLHCEIEGEPLTARVSGRVQAQPGAFVGFSFEPEALHIFDAATGQRNDDITADFGPFLDPNGTELSELTLHSHNKYPNRRA